jgi:predicted MFS family arabinose efflux permease
MSSQSSNGASEAGLRLTVAAAAAGFVTFVNMWCTQAILPVLAASLHVSQAATGYTVTAPLVATATMAPLIGAVSDRYGRKIFIAGAAFLLVIPTLLAAFAPSLGALVACRFAQGLLLPFIFTVTIAYIGDEMSGLGGMRLAGIYTSGTILGGFSGRFIAGLATEALGWRTAFLAIGVVTLALALLIAVLLPKEHRFRPVLSIGGALRSFPDHLTNPRLIATYAVGFGVLFSLVGVFTFINFRLAEAPYSLGPAALGAIFVVYLGGAVASPVAGRLAAIHGRLGIMAAAFLMVIGGLGLTLAAPLWAIGLGLLAICCGIFTQQTLATGFIGPAARAAKSTAVGLYVTFYYIGGSFGGIVPASLWHSAGWPGCAAIVAAMQVAMLVIASQGWRPLPGK